jgi:hypothetical protein
MAAFNPSLMIGTESVPSSAPSLAFDALIGGGDPISGGNPQPLAGGTWIIGLMIWQ